MINGLLEVVNEGGACHQCYMVYRLMFGCNGRGITSTNLFLNTSSLGEIYGDIVEEQISLDIVND